MMMAMMDTNERMSTVIILICVFTGKWHYLGETRVRNDNEISSLVLQVASSISTVRSASRGGAVTRWMDFEIERSVLWTSTTNSHWILKENGFLYVRSHAKFASNNGYVISKVATV